MCHFEMLRNKCQQVQWQDQQLQKSPNLPLGFPQTLEESRTWHYMQRQGLGRTFHLLSDYYPFMQKETWDVYSIDFDDRRRLGRAML
jgi:hypothetical protein